MQTLYPFSLAKKTDNGYVSIHPLVRVCARERCSMREKRKQAEEASTAIVETVRIENEHDYSNEQ